MANKENYFVRTSEFRVSHPHLFKPTSIKDNGVEGKPQYSIEMLFDKATTDLKTLQAPLAAAIKDKWGPNKADWPSPLLMPIRDGDVPKMNKKTRKKEVKKEHAGMWVVRASSSAEYNRPMVVGKNASVPLENESQMYPGCYARAGLKAHAYEFADKYGVKFILDAVQFIRDGEPLSSRKRADEIFTNIEGDDGDTDFVSGNEENELEEQESFM
jgi:hypothetical protein